MNSRNLLRKISIFIIIKIKDYEIATDKIFVQRKSFEKAITYMTSNK